MTTFDDRERGFESHFALTQDQEFRAVARRNRLLGEWAADRLGKSGEERDTYVREIIKADFEEAGEEDVFRRVARDLQGKAGEAEIRAEMARLLHIARQKVAEDAVGHN